MVFTEYFCEICKRVTRIERWLSIICQNSLLARLILEFGKQGKYWVGYGYSRIFSATRLAAGATRPEWPVYPFISLT